MPKYVAMQLRIPTKIMDIIRKEAEKERRSLNGQVNVYIETALGDRLDETKADIIAEAE